VTPPDTRRIVPETGDERMLLDAFLDFHRDTLRWKCAGLSDEQLRCRSVEPSSMSLLGLVRHLAEVELAWFVRRFAGRDVPLLYCSDDNPDGEFDDVDKADAATTWATYDEVIARANEAVAGASLDAEFIHPRDQQPYSLRWVYLHMVEEYARHNGHADLLRERIDGATGE
jgi:uncharacterized damage-inducible protein DinB